MNRVNLLLVSCDVQSINKGVMGRQGWCPVQWPIPRTCWRYAYRVAVQTSRRRVSCRPLSAFIDRKASRACGGWVKLCTEQDVKSCSVREFIFTQNTNISEEWMCLGIYWPLLTVRPPGCYVCCLMSYSQKCNVKQITNHSSEQCHLKQNKCHPL